jgi:hypothetical protein
MSIYVDDLRSHCGILGEAAADEIEDLEKAYALLFEENAKLRAALAAPIEPQPVRPLFAVSVARRKWESLQDEGYRMQRIEFAMSKDGQEKRGSIDPWGKVTWAAPSAGKPAPSAPEGGGPK